METHDANGPISWRILAMDGADVPAAHAAEHPAQILAGAGQTVDVELRPQGGDLGLIVRSFNDFEATIRVRPAG
jgi:hypothetical protein